ncbi:MAG: FAD-dependent oxidoreductase, partial [Dehalococcoidia bacterium]
DVFPGEARFLDHQTVTAGGTTLSARHFLISTGAHPFTPPIAGLEDVDYLTYENIWDLKVLPRRFTVIGAGPIGCEMAQAFHRLGAEVTLMEAAERLLPQDDVDASRALAEAFTSEGIDLRLGVSAQRVWQDGEGIHLVAGDSETVCDGLLVAVGRRPNVHGLDLEKAGVDHSERGIGVDRHLRTSRKHIYAAGDCTGGYQFTHYAGWQGFIAVRNALLPGAFRGVSEHVPWTTFTGPEVAHVGLTESQARERLGGEVMARQWPMDRVDRAQCEGETGGFLKLVYRKNGHLLGVTIVAAQAGEMINEWVVAMERGLKVDELAGAIHVYPTYATASMAGSAAVKVERLMGGLSGRIIRRLARVRR